MATVTYDHVTKKFGEVTAVNDLNIAVRDGEFLVLVGPAGRGKTTAVRMLAGLEEQTSGNIMIGERVVNDVAPKDRDIAMVFQNYALYPHMSVYDNIAFGLKLRNVPKQEIDRRVNEVGGMLGIGQLLKRKPKELSGGQRQRVAVGRAIAREPAVFLMDEPLSNLDVRPEDISDLAHARQDGQLPVDARVEVVEFLGNELQLMLSADSQNFVARVGTDTQTRPGATLRVGFNLRKLHVFDKQTEVALR